jgi:prepilin-type N-terminal cleavage/methylation domain-containing protein/prepilin-type processing-associated H-X9-DG protein
MKRADKAFTLVELLVVISIIAMLLAILMPALAKVREQGRTIVCASNLKNYGLALQMYANSNSDKFSDQYWLYSKSNIAAITGGTEAGKWLNGSKFPYRCLWHYEGPVRPDGSLFKYLQDKNINMCPTFKTFAVAGGLSGCPNKSEHFTPRGGGSMPFGPGFSYSGNAAIAGWKTPIMKFSDVKRPAQCAAFSEENTWGAIANYNNNVLNDTLLDIEYLRIGDNIATYHKVSTAKRETGYANVVYVDGHVKATKGLAGVGAGYLEYGKPYDGHENIWR